MITIDSLTKKYGGHTVVHDISFTARNGRVTGFLGPNGAGKSTSMRMMVGLTTPTEGTATISGRHFADLPNPGREVGVMLDASAQHAGRTGREILTIAQQIMGVPASRVAEMLDLVSLTRHRGRPAGGQLLARDAPAPRHRRRPDRRPVGAHPGRAGQRARPGRHPLDARPAPRLRRPRGDRPAVLPPADRDRDHRRRHRDDRAGADRLPGLQGRAPRRRRDRRPRRGRRRPPARAGRSRRSPRPSPRTDRSAPTRTPPWSDARRTTAAWCSPSSATPTVADSRRCSSSSPPTPNERGQRHDRHHRPSTRSAPVDVPSSRTSRSAGSSASSSARCSTPARDSG